MAIRLRAKKLVYSALAGAGVTLVISSTGGYFLYQNAQEREIALKQQYEAEVKELEAAALLNKVAFSLKDKVEKGDLITEDMLQRVYVPEAAAAGDLFIATVMGDDDKFYAKTDMASATVLTHAMVYENEDITKDVREGEYSFIELPSKVAVDDYLDIRIQFPTGDDFVLLSKKSVKDVLGLTVWLNVDEGEILTMSSAIVDAYISGAKIYAMPYVDEHMQDKSEMTYPVKENVKELIQESPNIVNRYKLNLEEQNRERVEANLETMDPSETGLLRNNEASLKGKVNQEAAQRSAEERVNAVNQATQTEQQQNLIGGGDK